MWLLRLSLFLSLYHSSLSFPKCQIIAISRICLFHGLGNWLDMWRLRHRKNQARRERLQKPLMNYDTSIILIGNKSGQGENKERRICASLIENKSCRQSFRFANWPTLKQTRQSCKRIGASSNAGFLSSPLPLLLSSLLWQIFHQTCAHVKRQIGVVAEDRWTYRRTLGKCCELWRGRAQVDPSNCSNPLLSALEPGTGEGGTERRYSLGPWPCLQCQLTWRMVVTVADDEANTSTGSSKLTMRMRGREGKGALSSTSGFPTAPTLLFSPSCCCDECVTLLVIRFVSSDANTRVIPYP